MNSSPPTGEHPAAPASAGAEQSGAGGVPPSVSPSMQRPVPVPGTFPPHMLAGNVGFPPAMMMPYMQPYPGAFPGPMPVATGGTAPPSEISQGAEEGNESGDQEHGQQQQQQQQYPAPAFPFPGAFAGPPGMMPGMFPGMFPYAFGPGGPLPPQMMMPPMDQFNQPMPGAEGDQEAMMTFMHANPYLRRMDAPMQYGQPAFDPAMFAGQHPMSLDGQMNGFHNPHAPPANLDDDLSDGSDDGQDRTVISRDAKKKIIEMHIRDKVTMKDVSKQLDVNYRTVQSIIRRYKFSLNRATRMSTDSMASLKDELASEGTLPTPSTKTGDRAASAPGGRGRAERGGGRGARGAGVRRGAAAARGGGAARRGRGAQQALRGRGRVMRGAAALRGRGNASARKKSATERKKIEQERQERLLSKKRAEEEKQRKREKMDHIVRIQQAQQSSQQGAQAPANGDTPASTSASSVPAKDPSAANVPPATKPAAVGTSAEVSAVPPPIAPGPPSKRADGPQPPAADSAASVPVTSVDA